MGLLNRNVSACGVRQGRFHTGRRLSGIDDETCAALRALAGSLLAGNSAVFDVVNGLTRRANNPHTILRASGFELGESQSAAIDQQGLRPPDGTPSGILQALMLIQVERGPGAQIFPNRFQRSIGFPKEVLKCFFQYIHIEYSEINIGIPPRTA
ncbi:MAG TPA: hypothetical protein PK250_05305 [Syntrophobacter fumaroxidans]|nr:hypothetical protein [Syntrophobacter fumaroxidans]